MTQSQKSTYSLIDSGEGQKLEQFGPFLISRPASQAVWKRENELLWKKSDASMKREGEAPIWNKGVLPEEWVIEVANLKFRLAPTDFGHLGIFPEQRPFWEWIQEAVAESAKKKEEQPQILNLFAYSGGSTLAAAKGGAAVCHVDASKGMVAWARGNAVLNDLEKAPIRWIIDDVTKFLKREVKRGKKYDAVILDPPSFGRGSQGEVFKIEEHIHEILDLIREVLSEKPLFILLSCHTPGFTPTTLHHLLLQHFGDLHPKIDQGEMFLSGDEKTLLLPSGSYAKGVFG